MQISSLRRAIRERFGYKVLFAFTIVIVSSLFVYTAVIAVYESGRLRRVLEERGETYAGFLAQGAVIGIFSENEELLRHAAAGIAPSRDVISVAMYDARRRLLYAEQGAAAGRAGAAPPPLPDGPAPEGTYDEPGAIVIVDPVLASPSAPRDDALYFDPVARDASRRTLGYVQVTLSTATYRTEVAVLVLRNVLLMALFITASLVFVAVLVRRALLPLDRLTSNVQAFEKGLPVEPAPVETLDEIGRLAAALNGMVAARRAAEEALRESEDRYRRLVELSPDGIYVQQDGRIVFINQAGARLLGAADPAPVVGRAVDAWVDAAVREHVARRMRQVESGEGALAPFPVLYRREDGAAVEAEATAAPFQFRGRPAALVIARDVTEQKRLEERVRSYEKELYAVAAEMTALEARVQERERYQIAADLHDFVGQNLVLLQFRLGAIAQALSGPDDQRRINELRELIAGTIEYTRTLTVELSPPDLDEIGLSGALDALGRVFSRAYGMHIAVRDEAGRMTLDRELRHQLYRSVRELLLNVVKHARAGEATVTLSRSDGRLLVTVEDDGVGCEPAAPAGETCGFGLNAIRERMERAGGSCAVAARPGGGTAVTLTVPVPH